MAFFLSGFFGVLLPCFLFRSSLYLSVSISHLFWLCAPKLPGNLYYSGLASCSSRIRENHQFCLSRSLWRARTCTHWRLVVLTFPVCFPVGTGHLNRAVRAPVSSPTPRTPVTVSLVESLARAPSHVAVKQDLLLAGGGVGGESQSCDVTHTSILKARHPCKLYDNPLFLEL